MAAHFARPYQPARNNGPSQTAPNAALLIDFDNVTMGIRSDLSKELKSLLNSDIIKGKVAVQRAYADWRRYPQYVVHLAEASVDLIFAPAYGSAKKNATDIRLAIDALELVFTRPEIGTFILLSGDSDFSSLVLKLKEYGKYVIGVGIRESASDILVQNCDEYYSYSSLSGLTRDSDEDRVRHDPWDLVEKAVQLMTKRRDVMRSDRLKQVMLELDGNFNEKEIGYSKFSRFLADAVARDKLKLRRGENGQWEVLPAGSEPESEPRSEARAPRDESRSTREESRSRRGGRGRDQDRSQDRDRAPREQREEQGAGVAAQAADSAAGTAKGETATEPVAAQRAAASEAPATESGTRTRSRTAPEKRVEVAGDPQNDIQAAYDLLRKAVDHLSGRNGELARDSDVKRRMLEILPGWDESTLGFSKFSRFLRQAHDAEVIDLHRGEGGSYQMAISTSRSRKQVETTRPSGRAAAARAAKADPTPSADQASARRAEPRRQARAEETRQTDPAKADKFAAYAEKLARHVEDADKPETAERDRAPSKEPRADQAKKSAEEPVAAKAKKPEAAEAPKAEQPTSEPAAQATVAAPRGIGARLGTRGRVAPAGPPPLLPGQAVGSPTTPEAEKAEKAEKPSATADKATADKSARQTAKRSAPAEKGPVVAEAAPARTLSEQLGLPTDAKAVEAYILNRYKGVGVRTIAALLDAFGAADLFGSLESQPDRVREVLGRSRRAELVLAAWKADLEQRTSGTGATSEEKASEPVAKPRGQTRRSSRSSTSRKKADTADAAARPATRKPRAKAKPKGEAEATGEEAARPAPRRRRATKPKATAGE